MRYAEYPWPEIELTHKLESRFNPPAHDPLVDDMTKSPCAHSSGPARYGEAQR
jgi:hypothetical protein